VLRARNGLKALAVFEEPPAVTGEWARLLVNGSGNGGGNSTVDSDSTADSSGSGDNSSTPVAEAAVNSGQGALSSTQPRTSSQVPP